MKQKQRKKQSGYTLIELMITVSIVGFLSLQFIGFLNEQASKSKADVIKWRLQYVANTMQRYYTDKVLSGSIPNDIDNYPDNLAALEPAYLNACTEDQVIAGECIDYKYLPYGNTTLGEPINVVRTMVSGYPEFAFEFSIENVGNDRDYNNLKRALTKLPGYSFDPTTETVKLSYQRPANIVSLDSKVSRDGSTPMTADWDYGGYDLNNIRYINQVEDISIKGVTDRTVLTGLRNTGSVKIESRNGVQVNKPECPVDYTPRIEVWKIGLGTNDVVYEPRNDIAWYVENTDTWTLKYKVSGKNSPSASVAHTWLYKGVVGYSTWCGL